MALAIGTLHLVFEAGLARDPIDCNLSAWKVLIEEGCDPELLFIRLVWCIRPPRAAVVELRRAHVEFKDYRKKCKRLARNLRKVSHEYWNLKQCGTVQPFWTDVVFTGPPLDALMEVQAACLDLVIAKGLKTKSRHLLTDDLGLVALCSYVKSRTTKKHYPDIAHLLTALAAMAGKQEATYDPDTISKKMRRFEERFGGACVARLGANGQE
jgi:hypothetical protein